MRFRIIALLTALLCLYTLLPVRPAQAGAEEEEEGTIKVDATLVNIPVTVSDENGRYIPSLKAGDFELYEDNTRQEIAFFSADTVPFSLALVLDVSGSTQESLRSIQQAAEEFIRNLRSGDRVMIVSFSNDLQIECDFTSDSARLHRAISNIRSGGSTRLYDAVYATVADKLSATTGRKAMILLTDGEDTTSRISATDSVEAVRESGAIVYVLQYPATGGSVIAGRGNRGNRNPWDPNNGRRGNNRRFPGNNQRIPIDNLPFPTDPNDPQQYPQNGQNDPYGYPPQGYPQGPQGQGYPRNRGNYPPNGYPNSDPNGYPPNGYPPQGYPQGPQGYPPYGQPPPNRGGNYPPYGQGGPNYPPPNYPPPGYPPPNYPPYGQGGPNYPPGYPPGYPPPNYPPYGRQPSNRPPFRLPGNIQLPFPLPFPLPIPGRRPFISQLLSEGMPQISYANYQGNNNGRNNGNNGNNGNSNGRNGQTRNVSAENYLRVLVDETGGNLYAASMMTDLTGLASKIANELRHVYVLGYYPTTGLEQGGYRHVKVKMNNRNNLKIRYKTGYEAAAPNAQTAQKS